MTKMQIIGGDKGGVGKTTAALSLAHTMLAEGRAIKMYDGDSVNPDFFGRTKSVGCQRFDVDSLAEWGSIIAETESSDVIINLPARGLEVFNNYADAMAEAAAELGTEIWYFHLMNPLFESVALLSSALERIDGYGGKVVAVRNNFFGDAQSFSLFNNSKVSAKCTLTLDLPRLADVVSQQFFNAKEGRSIDEVVESFKGLNKAIAKKWLRDCAATWQPVMSD